MLSRESPRDFKGAFSFIVVKVFMHSFSYNRGFRVAIELEFHSIVKNQKTTWGFGLIFQLNVLGGVYVSLPGWFMVVNPGKPIVECND